MRDEQTSGIGMVPSVAAGAGLGAIFGGPVGALIGGTIGAAVEVLTSGSDDGYGVTRPKGYDDEALDESYPGQNMGDQLRDLDAASARASAATPEDAPSGRRITAAQAHESAEIQKARKKLHRKIATKEALALHAAARAQSAEQKTERRLGREQTRQEAADAARQELATTDGFVSVGYIKVDPYRSRGAKGPYDFGGYNTQAFSYLPYGGQFTPLGKYQDDPFGGQRVGQVDGGRIVIGRLR